MRLPGWLARFRRRPYVPAADRAGRNSSDDFIRAEFKRRYLIEFAGYVGRDRAASGEAGARFFLLAMLLGGASMLGPVLGLAGTGLAMLTTSIARAASPRWIRAGLKLGQQLDNSAPGANRVEAWLDRNMDDLPTYLDRLDREEADRRRMRTLIEQINKAGAAAVSVEERRFLATRGIRRLKPPILLEPPLPPRMRLSNWHHAQLARALWSDLGRF